MERSRSHSEVPELIDFFKSEMPLRQDRHMGKQEYLYKPGNQQWSPNPTLRPASLERAIADSAKLQPEPILVDFFKGGNGDGDPHYGGGGDDDHHHHHHHQQLHLGVDAAVFNRSSSAVEAKHHPMAKLKDAAGEQWSLQVANPPTVLKIVSPTSTGTEESGTAAPKTPTCDMEIAYRRHNEYSAQQGSTFSPDSGQIRVNAHDDDGHARRHGEMMIRNLVSNGEEVCAESGTTSHGWKRLRRITPAHIAPPLMRSEPLDKTPTSRFCDASTQTHFSDSSPLRSLREVEDEEAEAVVQAATSLLSLASNEGICHRRPLASSSSMGPLESEREVDEVDGAGRSCVGACSSVLSRPSNKRRYRLVVDLLEESPNVR